MDAPDATRRSGHQRQVGVAGPKWQVVGAQTVDPDRRRLPRHQQRMRAVNHFLPLSKQTRFAERKIILQRQLPDFRVQRLKVNGGSFAVGLAAPNTSAARSCN
jgi:hypothetical protein